MKVVTASEMRAIELRAVEQGTPLEELMRYAGEALADAARTAAQGGQILILAGPGNNGGDGVLAARILKEGGSRITLYTFRRNHLDEDAIDVIPAEKDSGCETLRRLLEQSAVVVDALLGIGQTRPPEGLLADVITCVNESHSHQKRVFAADIPTGVNADTGAVPGQAIRADSTLSMGLLKVGNVVYPGAEYAGNVQVVDVGIPENLSCDVRVSRPSTRDIATLLPSRSPESNKGTYGHLVFVGGSQNFLGAPSLASVAAYRIGAGLVEIATTALVASVVASHALEPIFRVLPEHDGRISSAAVSDIRSTLQRASALVFGPGMGLSDDAIELTRAVLDILPDSKVRGAVIDADALNALSRMPDWWHVDAKLILTPHPGEMSRLARLSVGEIQGDRLSVARKHAMKWNKVLVLKGAGTIVASPDGEAVVNPTGSSNLATAGAGDVLSGIIGGLLAQGCSPFEAAVVGTYVHGWAGDVLRGIQGDAGTLAGDLLPEIPRARQTIIDTSKEAV